MRRARRKAKLVGEPLRRALARCSQPGDYRRPGEEHGPGWLPGGGMLPGRGAAA